MTVFGATYAGAYDKLYLEKDYDAECNMIEALIGQAGNARKGRLIDLGCGTGNHAVPLAQRGYSVTGLDLSEAMLARARQKAAAAQVEGRTQFHQGDVRKAMPGEQEFDAAIMMFAVMGYQQSDEDVLATLRATRAYLPLGAPFLFDVWYGPGVMADKPGAREREIEQDGKRIVRRTKSFLDEGRNLCTVKFDLEVWEGKSITAQVREEHVMRFFFPAELEAFSSQCGFAMESLRNFPAWEEAVSLLSWNAVGVMRAV